MELSNDASRNTKARFEAKYLPEPMSGCWLWTAAYFKSSGYGAFNVDGHKIDCAHRASWRLHRGEIPTGMFVCHRCDVRECVNPDHLFLGTQAQNIADCIDKDRFPMLERHGGAKLNADTVRAIRASTGRPVDAAKRFGVTANHVRMIRSRQIWFHLAD